MTDNQDQATDAGADGPVRDCQHTQVTHTHGTRQAYVADRCRCGPCTLANTLSARKRAMAIAYGTWPGLVGAEPARAHVQQLRAAGLSLKHLAALSGVSRGTLDALIYGDPARQAPPSARVRARTEQRLLATRFDIELLPATARIPATGSRRRLQALAVAGWSIPALSARTALPKRTLRAVLTGQAVSVATATRVAALFARLRDTSPPASSAEERAAIAAVTAQARAAAWRPPYAWEDIDMDSDRENAMPDPTNSATGPDQRPASSADLLDEVAIERAMRGEPMPLTDAERRAAVARLTERGRSVQRIAELLHMNHRAVVRWRADRDVSAA